MSISKDKPASPFNGNGEMSEAARLSLQVHQASVDEALDRKRRLGQYWVVWDGEKPVKVYPDTTQTAAE